MVGRLCNCFCVMVWLLIWLLWWFLFFLGLGVFCLVICLGMLMWSWLVVVDFFLDWCSLFIGLFYDLIMRLFSVRDRGWLRGDFFCGIGIVDWEWKIGVDDVSFGVLVGSDCDEFLLLCGWLNWIVMGCFWLGLCWGVGLWKGVDWFLCEVLSYFC